MLANQKLVKENNIKTIFNLISNSSGISRVNLSKITNLSRATVSALVGELLELGLVVTKGEGESLTSGRKPIIVEVNKEKAVIGAISLKKYGFTFSLYNMNCEEIKTVSSAVKYTEGFVNRVFSYIGKIIDYSQLIAVCVSIPASINIKTKQVILSVLEISQKCNIYSEFEKSFSNIPIVFCNESATYAYAEKELVEKNRVNNLIFINIDEGVGAGIVANSKIFKGAYGYAGEFGHMSVDINGPKCICGRSGCLEKLINKMAIIEKYRDIIRRGKNTILYELCDGEIEKINYGVISVAIKMQDEQCIIVAEEIAAYLAFAISNLIVVFNPEEIIIGGGIEVLGKDFLNMLEGKIELPKINGDYIGDMKIRYTKLNTNDERKAMTKYFLDNILKITIKTQNGIHIW